MAETTARPYFPSDINGLRAGALAMSPLSVESHRMKQVQLKTGHSHRRVFMVAHTIEMFVEGQLSAGARCCTPSGFSIKKGDA